MYCEASSIGGMRYLTYKGLLIKSFWSCILSTCLLLCIYQVAGLAVPWAKPQVVSSVELRPVDMLPLPDITICPPHKIRWFQRIMMRPIEDIDLDRLQRLIIHNLVQTYTNYYFTSSYFYPPKGVNIEDYEDIKIDNCNTFSDSLRGMYMLLLRFPLNCSLKIYIHNDHDEHVTVTFAYQFYKPGLCCKKNYSNVLHDMRFKILLNGIQLVGSQTPNYEVATENLPLQKEKNELLIEFSEVNKFQQFILTYEVKNKPKAVGKKGKKGLRKLFELFKFMPSETIYNAYIKEKADCHWRNTRRTVCTTNVIIDAVEGALQGKKHILNDVRKVHRRLFEEFVVKVSQDEGILNAIDIIKNRYEDKKSILTYLFHIYQEMLELFKGKEIHEMLFKRHKIGLFYFDLLKVLATSSQILEDKKKLTYKTKW